MKNHAWMHKYRSLPARARAHTHTHTHTHSLTTPFRAARALPLNHPDPLGLLASLMSLSNQIKFVSEEKGTGSVRVYRETATEMQMQQKGVLNLSR